MQWAIKYTVASSKETVKESATSSVLGIKYSSITWRNISLKDPFSLSDGEYPMVWKWLDCEWYGANHSKVYRQFHDPKPWKQWLLIPVSLGSTVLLSEEQRALPENMTFSGAQEDGRSSVEAMRSCSTECAYSVKFLDIRSHLEVMVSVLSVLQSCQRGLKSCLSKWCWWQLWWFCFSWCLPWDCTTQLTVSSFTQAAQGMTDRRPTE